VGYNVQPIMQFSMERDRIQWEPLAQSVGPCCLEFRSQKGEPRRAE